jgi:tRNA(adenine34) deaminase
MTALLDVHKMDLAQRDAAFMREALKEAKKALAQDEVPVGAVLALRDQVIARGYNQVELLQDATAHAEMICLTAGAGAIGNWRLSEATLYCTLEPCSMCAGAMFASRLKRLVWAAPDIRVGANGSWIDLFASEHPIHRIEVLGKVLEAEAADLLRAFFQKRRAKKSESCSKQLEKSDLGFG